MAMKNVIACGHRLTAKAASHAIEHGGNAFDAVVAACIASCVVEPMLTTAAGGGIGLLRFADGETKCIEFLAGYPAAAKKQPVKPIKKVVNFGDQTQVFYLGYGSLAVPGTLQGLLHIHKRYCSLELKDILAPAIRYARGHRLNRLQARVLKILEPFCLYTKEAREIFAPRGRLLKQGEIIRNEKITAFLEMLADDREAALSFYHDSIEQTLEGRKSTLSINDVKSYRVAEKEPVSTIYRSYEIDLAALPSAGGTLVAYALKLIEKRNIGGYRHNSAEHIRVLAKAMEDVDSRRTKEFFRHLLYEKGFWKKFLNRLGGTTHVSVIDSEGNAASITTSNGQGAGIMAGDTGIMLNNFAAEPDLMQYKKVYRPGGRITSMMSPTIISKGGKLKAVLGTGGSIRIRSAILQTTSNLIDFGMSPQEATDAPRVHLEDGLLQLEYGIGKDVIKELQREYRTNVWTEKNLYFGGVHIAAPDAAGGDKRRGGSVLIKK